MAVRLKEGLIPYTGGIGIEITNNHIINVLLREANNLIHVNGNRELYVDLQLDDVILPDDDFPVGVTTGKILEENGWEQSGLILNWKTTSGDYARIIYAVDDNIYMDCGDGVWRLLGISEEVLAQINTQTFYITDEHDLTNGQKAYDWYNEGKDALIGYDDAVYTLVGTSSDTGVLTLEFRDTRAVIEDGQSTSTSKQEFIKLNVLESTNTISSINIGEIQISPNVLATGVNYNTPYTPEYLGSPTTKKYVDDGLATKQPLLTAGTRITIDQNNVISADVTGLFIYKGNVATVNDLPANPTVGDTYLVEATGLLYAWDGTQWNPLGSTAIDLSNYFNKTTDTTDNITEGSLNLFCTSTEKNYWNLKQDRLTAGAGITINQNNVISTTPYNTGEGIDITGQTITNTLPFKPDNTGTALQVLKRIGNGYQWLDENNTTYTAGTGINIDANNVISNTGVTSVNGDTGTVTVKEFEPGNTGVNGQILRKTTSGYEWSNESGGGGGGGGGGNFNPQNQGEAGQVLTKTNNGYAWLDSTAGESNVKCFAINLVSVSSQELKIIVDYIEQGSYYGAIIKTPNQQDVFIYSYKIEDNGTTKRVFPGLRDHTRILRDYGYTQFYDNALAIEYDGSTYTASEFDFNQLLNVIEPTGADYNTAFIPTADHQPTTKKYVDSRNRVGTQAQYNALVNQGLIDSTVIYNII